MPEIQANILAIIVVSVGSFALGGLWYSPILFGRGWVKAHGFSDSQIAEMQKSAGPGYIVSLVGYVVMALVFSAIMSYATEINELLEGLWLGFLVWGGFVLTTGLTNAIFSGKSIRAHMIDTGYQLVYMLMMGAVLAIWR